MTLPYLGESVGKLGIPKSAEPLDWCGWPLAVPTAIVGAVGSKFIVGAYFENYNPLAPDSTIAVWLLWLRWLQNLKWGGATANSRRSFICFKIIYFNCNIFYVSGPTLSQAAFPICRALAGVIP